MNDKVGGSNYVNRQKNLELLNLYNGRNKNCQSFQSFLIKKRYENK